MTVTPIATAERNYLKGVLRAFLEGKKNQNYVIGCFKNVPIKIFDEIIIELNSYSNHERFRELSQIRRELLTQLEERTTRTNWSPWALGKYE